MTDKQKQNKKSRGKHKRFDHKKKFDVQKRKWQLVDEEIGRLTTLYKEVDPNDLRTFADFPLSENTKKGLESANYQEPTEIQHESILLALKGNDILGAAKTGSGKTLAFIVPILETLFRAKWNPMDGLGALVITPTRELAYQIFEVLRKVGKYHDFSAGLVIGGKHIKEESERISQTNIVICTPGRLLQHMDETAFFHANNLQILVLDEADRILDLGFQQSMNAIIENLPKRQTLLFSATQTKSVKDLARLSLKDPMYVSVHEMSAHSTPSKLTQSFVVCELHDKINFLWSFIKNHLKSKVLVFLSSCKQVRFVHELFRRLRPGTNVMALHGAMQQLKRIAMYDAFLRKQHAVMFATDIAARGLDFPAVNWVVQLDCPEDANTYIHRAGRTARYKDDGEALLVLLPSEKESMVEELMKKKIPINEIKVNPKKLWSIHGKMESLCASDVTMKQYAQRAFVSYLKSVFLMSNKKVFKVTELDTDQFARSIGLAISPRVRFIQKEKKPLAEKETASKKRSATDVNQTNKKKTSAPKSESSSEDDSEDEDDEEEEEESGEEGHVTKTADKKHEAFDFGGGNGDDDEDIFTVKKRIDKYSDDSEKSDDEAISLEGKDKKQKTLSKAALAKKLMKKKITPNVRVTFDNEGEAVVDMHKVANTAATEDDNEGGIDITQAKQRMMEEDKFDKQLYREKIKQKHKEKRLKEKEERRKQKKTEEEEDDEEPIAVLGNADSPSDAYDYQDEDEAESDEAEDDSIEADSGAGDESDAADDDESNESEDDDHSDACEDSEDEESEEGGPPLKKARRVKGSGEEFDTGLTLQDDEAIALKLLQS